MRPIAALCALALLLPLLTGCGVRTARVSGQVRYPTQPVPGGTIMFKPVQPGREIATAALNEEGRYELTVAVGDVQILVDNRELAPREKAGKPELPAGLKLPTDAKIDRGTGERGHAADAPPGKYREIPPKYYQFETSELTHQVTSEATQTHDIDLK